MADFRLVQSRNNRTWLIMGTLALIGLTAWASALVLGDATTPRQLPQVGATADFGAVRAPVLPFEAVPLGSLMPLQTRDHGRFVRIVGVAESGIAVGSVWVRTQDGYRILVRFEPTPATQLLSGIGPGSAVRFNGYLQTIARAEFNQVMDSLNVFIPRPPAARKFGDVPPPGFARADSLFVKTYYISVRPEGIRPDAPPDNAAEPTLWTRPRPGGWIGLVA